MNHLVATARALGYTELLGEYLPTAKNAPVKTLLEDFGFVHDGDGGPGWSRSVTNYAPQATQVARHGGAEPVVPGTDAD